MRSARISARQHLVPGMTDFSEDELQPTQKSGIDLWTFLVGAGVALGIGLLVWGTRLS